MDLTILIGVLALSFLVLGFATKEAIFLYKLKKSFQSGNILIKTKSDPGIGKLVAQHVKGKTVEFGVSILKEEVDLKLIIERNVRQIEKMIDESKASNVVIFNADILCRNNGKHMHSLITVAGRSNKRLILITEDVENISNFQSLKPHQIKRISDQFKNRKRVAHIKAIGLSAFVGVMALFANMSVELIINQQSSVRNVEKAQLMYDLYDNKRCGLCLEYIRDAGLKGHMVSAMLFQSVYTNTLKDNGAMSQFNPEYVLSLPAPKTRMERELYKGIVTPLIRDGLIDKDHLNKMFSDIEDDSYSLFKLWSESYEEPDYYDIEFKKNDLVENDINKNQSLVMGMIP